MYRMESSHTLIAPEQTAEAPITVVGLIGSVHAGSISRQACEVALEGIASGGGVAKLIDLADLSIPLYLRTIPVPRVIVSLRASIESAVGLILVSPEYHGNYTGAFKNVLDWLSQGAFIGKVAGCIGIGGGTAGGLRVLDSLNETARHLGAWTVPQGVWIPGHSVNRSHLTVSFAADLEVRLRVLGEAVLQGARRLGPVIVDENVR